MNGNELKQSYKSYKIWGNSWKREIKRTETEIQRKNVRLYIIYIYIYNNNNNLPVLQTVLHSPYKPYELTMNRPKPKPTQAQLKALFGTTDFKTFDDQPDYVKPKPKKPRNKPSDSEWKLQSRCVKWFRMQYPQYTALLCSNRNNVKDQIEGAREKMIGMVPGRSDLVLYFNGTATHIEMKLPGNYQQPNQKEWQAQIEAQGFAYHVCKSLEEFQELIRSVI